MKQEYTDLIKAARLDLLDCEVVGIYVRRNELTGRPDPNDRKPYEIVIGVPISMGERGINISMYYDGLPTAEQLYNDVRSEIKEYATGEGGRAFDVFVADGGRHMNLRIEAVKKALRTAPKKWAEIKRLEIVLNGIDTKKVV